MHTGWLLQSLLICVLFECAVNRECNDFTSETNQYQLWIHCSIKKRHFYLLSVPKLFRSKTQQHCYVHILCTSFFTAVAVVLSSTSTQLMNNLAPWTNGSFSQASKHQEHLSNEVVEWISCERILAILEIHTKAKRNNKQEKKLKQKTKIKSLPEILIHRRVFCASRLTMYAKTVKNGWKREFLFMCLSISSGFSFSISLLASYTLFFQIFSKKN